MMATQYGTLFAYIIGAILLLLMGRLLLAPLKLILKLLYNAILGGVVLLAINFIGEFFGFHIAFNYVTAFITGFLGVPGVAVLILLKLLL